MASKLWKDYNAKNAYDGYFTADNKLRKHAKIISGILEKYGKKKLQQIENILNNMPRKILGYKTPNQVWNEELKNKAYQLNLSTAQIMNEIRNGFYGFESQRLQIGTNEVKIWIRYNI